MNTWQHEHIPFGKHQDKPIDKIPQHYLKWLLAQEWFLDEFDYLAAVVKAYLNSLGGPKRPEQSQPKTSLTTDLVKTWHRRLVLRWHPDRYGGSHQAMVAINDAHTLLKELIGGAS